MWKIHERVFSERDRLGLLGVVVEEPPEEPERLTLRDDRGAHRILELDDEGLHLLVQPLTKPIDLLIESRHRTLRR
jgi:hypothetical protein